MARLDWYIRANLKLRQLQLLVAMDDFRHVGKVALMLNVTQPAISKSLNELQSALDVRLFERNGRNLQPTYAGECLIRHARILLKHLDDAGDELHGLVTGHAGRLRLAVLPAAASALLPRGLALLKEQFPEAAVFVREGTMDLLLPELRTGHVELILGTLPARRAAPDLEEKALYDDPTVLVVGRHHPLAQGTKLDWADLAPFPWILPPQGSLLREPLLATFHANGMNLPADTIETLSSNVVLNHVQMSLAIASLPASVARRYAELGMLAVLPVPLSHLVRPVGLIWLKERAMTPLMQHFVGCMEKVVVSLTT
jgi:DNA-binding transcriptional LysR family regulator